MPLRRIVDAAARLFVRDGYAAMSIAATAREAGVAVPTVDAGLRSKAGILRAVVELTVRGGDDAVPLTGRAAWQDIEHAHDPHERLARFARLHRQICEREAPVLAQREAAAGADQEATELLAVHDRMRYETRARLPGGLAHRGRLRPAPTERQAADSVGRRPANAPTSRPCATAHGTSDDDERWLTEQLVAALLPSGSR